MAWGDKKRERNRRINSRFNYYDYVGGLKQGTKFKYTLTEIWSIDHLHRIWARLVKSGIIYNEMYRKIGKRGKIIKGA